jgi:hypothetical protein
MLFHVLLELLLLLIFLLHLLDFAFEQLNLGFQRLLFLAVHLADELVKLLLNSAFFRFEHIDLLVVLTLHVLG